jgi:hypothetical protein
MNTITYRQDNPAARIAIILASVTVTCALLIYAFGLIDIINAAESSRQVPGGHYVVAIVVWLIFFPPVLILLRLLTPKNELVFGESALTIKAGREQKSITYAQIGSMIRDQFLSPRLELYDHAGRLLHCFRTGMDQAALSSIVRLITERIVFDARDERKVVRYFRR